MILCSDEIDHVESDVLQKLDAISVGFSKLNDNHVTVGTTKSCIHVSRSIIRGKTENASYKKSMLLSHSNVKISKEGRRTSNVRRKTLGKRIGQEIKRTKYTGKKLSHNLLSTGHSIENSISLRSSQEMFRSIIELKNSDMSSMAHWCPGRLTSSEYWKRKKKKRIVKFHRMHSKVNSSRVYTLSKRSDYVYSKTHGTQSETKANRRNSAYAAQIIFDCKVSVSMFFQVIMTIFSWCIWYGSTPKFKENQSVFTSFLDYSSIFTSTGCILFYIRCLIPLCFPPRYTIFGTSPKFKWCQRLHMSYSELNHGTQ